jgi:CIC family chloride channel protein
LMVSLGIGRLPVVSKTAQNQVIGILTRSDLLASHARRLRENARTEPRLKIPFVRIVRV